MAEKQTDYFSDATQASIDRVMSEQPRSLREAIHMDLNALLPQSESAINRRKHVLRMGRNALVGLGLTGAVMAGSFGVLKLDEATKQPVESLFNVIGQGDTVDANFSETVNELENRTGMDLGDNVLRTPESDAKGDLLNQITDENGVYHPASYTVEVSKGGLLGLPYIDVEASTKPNTEIPDPDAPKN